MKLNNCGKTIQKFAGLILAVSIIVVCVSIIIEVAGVGIWDFGSLKQLVVMDALILIAGFTLFLLLYGFGEIVINVRKICEMTEEMT
ncbi:MAG: hypothetical protein E7455_00480 [Ruminococcaceae bacterium]|nr:hypothetical protein [Oscillospiraceae bacterium]